MDRSKYFLRADGVYAIPGAAGGDGGGEGGPPDPHHATHEAGGADPVQLAQSQVTGLSTALAGKVDTTDPRLADARTPTAHAASHGSGGSDPVTLAPAQVTGLTAALATKVDTTGTPAAGQLALFSDADTITGSSALTLTGGVLTVTGGQVKFPATQVPSSDATTLDDYREGTWTPYFGSTGGESGQTYLSQVGRYIKIGRVVHTSGRIALSTLGTLSFELLLKGFPFTSENTALLYFMGTVNWDNFATALTSLALRMPSNATHAYFVGNSGAVSSQTTLNPSVLGPSSVVTFALTYMAAN